MEEEIDLGDPVRPEIGEVVGFEFLRAHYSAKEQIVERERAFVQQSSKFERCCNT